MTPSDVVPKTQPLTRGARATFYFNGTDVYSSCMIPETGAFVVRSLPAGRWVVKDSCGGSATFAVHPGQESTTILVGDTPGVTGEPGSSGSSDSAALRVGPGGGAITDPAQVAPGVTVTTPIAPAVGGDPHERPAPVARKSRAKVDAGDEDSRVAGAAGSSLVQDVPIRSVDEMMKAAKEPSAE